VWTDGGVSRVRRIVAIRPGGPGVQRTTEEFADFSLETVVSV